MSGVTESIGAAEIAAEADIWRRRRRLAPDAGGRTGHRDTGVRLGHGRGVVQHDVPVGPGPAGRGPDRSAGRAAVLRPARLRARRVHDATRPRRGADRVYVGRRHVRDDDGTPLVVDWRAPVSMPFYRATPEDPQGVRRRRRYGFSDTAQLTAYEDEQLGGGATPGQRAADRGDRTAASGPMRDIVATIQPEQDELVRAPLQPSICVQGAPGTGKTAVGLHRLAYLLYTEPSRLTGGVTVVGPNRSFLSYIRHVLPALGEVSVLQKTIDELIDRPVTAADAPRGRPAQGRRADGRGAAPGVVGSRRASPTEDLVYMHGATRYRVARGRVAPDRGRPARQHPLRARPGRRRAAAGHLVLMQMERRGAPRTTASWPRWPGPSRSKQLLDAVWPKLHAGAGAVPAAVRRRVPGRRRRREFTPDEQATLLWAKPYRSAEVGQVVGGRRGAARRAGRPDRPHAVARATSWSTRRRISARCSAGRWAAAAPPVRSRSSATSRRGRAPWAVDDWPTLLAHLGKPDTRLAVLDRGFPGAGADHRVRRPAAARHRARPGRADVGTATRRRVAAHATTGDGLPDAVVAGVPRTGSPTRARSGSSRPTPTSRAVPTVARGRAGSRTARSGRGRARDEPAGLRTGEPGQGARVRRGRRGRAEPYRRRPSPGACTGCTSCSRAPSAPCTSCTPRLSRRHS